MSSTNVDYLKQVALIISIIVSVVTTVVSSASVKTDIEVIKEQNKYIKEYIDSDKVKKDLLFSEIQSQDKRISNNEITIETLLKVR